MDTRVQISKTRQQLQTLDSTCSVRQVWRAFRLCVQSGQVRSGQVYKYLGMELKYCFWSSVPVVQ